MPQVKPVRTPHTLETVSRAFAGAWERRFHEPIRQDVLALLLGHSDLETATWRKVFHHNLGFLIIGSSNIGTTGRNFFVLDGDEGPGTGSDAAEHFYKAFDSLQDGADEQVAQVTRASRQQWWDALLTGDPERYVRALNGQFGGPSYFEAGFDGYLRAFLTRWQKYAPPSAPPVDPGPSPTIPDPLPFPRLSERVAADVATTGAVLVVVGAGLLWAVSRATKARPA